MLRRDVPQGVSSFVSERRDNQYDHRTHERAIVGSVELELRGYYCSKTQNLNLLIIF